MGTRMVQRISSISAAYSALSPTGTTRSTACSTFSNLSSASNNTVIVNDKSIMQKLDEIDVEDEGDFVFLDNDTMPEPKTLEIDIDPDMTIMKKSTMSSSKTTDTPPTPETPNSRSMDDSNGDHFDRLMKTMDENIAKLSNATVTSSESNNQNHIEEGAKRIENTPEPPLKNTGCACVIL